MSKTRESGFYFVRKGKNEEFEIGRWSEYPPCWELIGLLILFKDQDMAEIDERRIVREEPKNPNYTIKNF